MTLNPQANLQHIVEEVISELQAKKYEISQVEYNRLAQCAHIYIREKTHADFQLLRQDGYNPLHRGFNKDNCNVTIRCDVNLLSRSVKNGSSNSKTKTQDSSEPVRDTTERRKTRPLSDQRQGARTQSPSAHKRRTRRQPSRQATDKTPGEQDVIRQSS